MEVRKGGEEDKKGEEKRSVTELGEGRRVEEEGGNR